ncbi:four-carbon acid sugar kinase family protein [Ramlibacter monticola]|uniref:3-oxo-tetronate kinase n=1 Tax=Ramlibacter monticola TaxID=1926872 RepID=A0A936Z121_9BURK|nr:3-oxo-tetronate kinase [Ramlibacter monticola]MBL0392301.1 four-carbon acid sugar kinase family protein [Ramlibacter monticola]
MRYGVIADDFTGATDVASMLVRAGLRTVQAIGVPRGPAPDADAVVVALKSRTTPAAAAVAESLAALEWLRAAGARRFYFKYCSTFDSTPQGNIGPVADALMHALGTDLTVVCPAFPENGRTIYMGHLFVGEALLSDSGMRDHPLTPMRDASLVRLLQGQVPAGQQVGLVPHAIVAQGAEAVRGKLAALRATGVRYAVTDALTNQDLCAIAEACEELPLVTAASGLALGMKSGGAAAAAQAAQLPPVGGAAAVVSGSCSVATQGQVANWMDAGRPAFKVDAARCEDGGAALAQEALAWAASRLPAGPVLVYATANPAEVRAVQQRFGVERAGAMVEACLARVARGLVDQGVRRLVIAGGETSGAVVKELEIAQLRIGPTIAPGVPWTWAPQRGLLLALKSGNFGTPDFFERAIAMSA